MSSIYFTDLTLFPLAPSSTTIVPLQIFQTLNNVNTMTDKRTPFAKQAQGAEDGNEGLENEDISMNFSFMLKRLS